MVGNSQVRCSLKFPPYFGIRYIIYRQAVRNDDKFNVLTKLIKFYGIPKANIPLFKFQFHVGMTDMAMVRMKELHYDF